MNQIVGAVNYCVRIFILKFINVRIIIIIIIIINLPYMYSYACTKTASTLKKIDVYSSRRTD
jgi:hypothetical protein